MQTRPNRLCKPHILLATVLLWVEAKLDVERSNHFNVAELPDVELVHGLDTGDAGDVVLDLVEDDALRDALQKDLGGGFDEGDGGAGYDAGDEEGDGGVGVRREPGVREVHEIDGGEHDADVSKGITEDVKEHALHVQVLLLFLLGLGFGVVVTGVPGRRGAAGFGEERCVFGSVGSAFGRVRRRRGRLRRGKNFLSVHSGVDMDICDRRGKALLPRHGIPARPPGGLVLRHATHIRAREDGFDGAGIGARVFFFDEQRRRFFMVVRPLDVVMRVRMAVITATVSVIVEQKQPEDVGRQPGGPDAEDKEWTADGLVLEKPLDRFEENGKTQRKKENGVDERSKNFGSLPAVRVVVGAFRFGELDRPECY